MRRAREALDVKCSNPETNDASRVTTYASRPQQFLYIALGSCAELETQVEIAIDLGYLDRKDRDRLVEDAAEPDQETIGRPAF